MPRSGKMRDLIQAKRKQKFTGRKQQLYDFRYALKTDPPEALIFFISGQGGVGKTELLKRYQEIAREHNFLVIESDELAGDLPAILHRFATQLHQAGHDLKEFAESYRRYEQIKSEIAADDKAPEGWADLVGRTTARVGLALVEEVPGLKSAARLLKPDAIEEQAGLWATYLARKLGNKSDDVALMRDPVAYLSRPFFQELNKLAARQKILLCFDNFEYTRPYLDPWLATLPTAYDLEYSIYFAIASRTPPRINTHWEDLILITQHTALEEFTPQECTEFLDTYAVTDPARRQEIINLSAGLPVYMAMLASAESGATDTSAPVTTIVGRFLRWVNEPQLRRVVLHAALARYFDVDTLTPLLPAADLTERDRLFDWLCQHPFVHRREQGWSYHPNVRRLMLQYQSQRSDDDYRQLHTKLAAFYADQLTSVAAVIALGASSPDPGSVDWDNAVARQAALNRAYHHFLAAPYAHWPAFLNDFALSLPHITVVGQLWLQLIQDLLINTDVDPVHRQTLSLLAEQLPQLADTAWQNGIDLFDHLCVYQALSPQARSTLHRLRGLAHRNLKNYEAALHDFDQALVLNPQLIPALIGRAQTYRSLSQFDKALFDLTQAVAAAPEDPWYHAYRGDTYRFMRDYTNALTDLNKAIALDPKHHWAFTQRGAVFQSLQRYTEALADFEQSITLAPQYTWALVQRGRTYRFMQEYTKALADFNAALERNPSDLSALTNRAMAYSDLGQYDQSLADFSRAIELNNQYAWAIAQRGEIYRRTENYALAFAEIDTALTLDPTLYWAVKTRAEIYRDLGQLDQALAVYSGLPESEPDAAQFIGSRGETYLLLGQLRPALKDIEYAIKNYPTEDWWFYLRALIYCKQNWLRKGSVQLQHAIDLATQRYQQQPNDARVAFNLALYHLANHQVDQARIIYQQTIHADPPLTRIRIARRDLDDYHSLFPDPAAIAIRALLTTAYEQRRARLGQSSIQPIGDPIHDRTP